MVKCILAALAFFGISHTATAPPNGSSPKQPPAKAPSQKEPVRAACTDGQPVPPGHC